MSDGLADVTTLDADTLRWGVACGTPEFSERCRTEIARRVWAARSTASKARRENRR